MYARILVALDGSKLAEAVLPYVEPLAERFGSTLILLRAVASLEMLMAESGGTMAVATPIIDPVGTVQAEGQEAAGYLEALAAPLRARGISVECEQPEGPAANAIVERARQLQADLIAMTTHGRSGLGRLVFGSIADAVLRSAPCPILLVRVSDHRA